MREPSPASATQQAFQARIKLLDDVIRQLEANFDERQKAGGYVTPNEQFKLEAYKSDRVRCQYVLNNEIAFRASAFRGEAR
jgi:hypothetical protein